MSEWKCDACAEAEGGSGLPCTLTSDMINDQTELMCPISGEAAEFELIIHTPPKEVKGE